MVLDFLTTEWGQLTYGDECVLWFFLRGSCTDILGLCREACIISKAGKNSDGYFTADDLIKQVDKAIDIFKDQTNRFVTGLFCFDNVPSHQKHADNALSAQKMPKNLSQGWMHRKGSVQMWNMTLVDGQTQELYWDPDHPTMPGWFKGMEQIIQEHGLLPNGGLLAQCEGFKCEPSHTDCCCCWRLLFLYSQILFYRNLNSKSLWHLMDTHVISTRNITVSLILLNSTGVLKNSDIKHQCAHQMLLKWKKTCLHVWMIFIFFKWGSLFLPSIFCLIFFC
jgi:hypothetical protein